MNVLPLVRRLLDSLLYSSKQSPLKCSLANHMRLVLSPSLLMWFFCYLLLWFTRQVLWVRWRGHTGRVIPEKWGRVGGDVDHGNVRADLLCSPTPTQVVHHSPWPQAEKHIHGYTRHSQGMPNLSSKWWPLSLVTQYIILIANVFVQYCGSHDG